MLGSTIDIVNFRTSFRIQIWYLPLKLKAWGGEWSKAER